MAMKASDVCEELVHKVPLLAGLLKEHIEDYDELLPHVFMGEVSRYVVSYREGRKQIGDFLDECFRDCGDDIQNLIAVSFVENLVSEDEFERALDGASADALRKEWRKQREA